MPIPILAGAIISALAPVLAETAAREILGKDSPVSGKVADAVVSVASQVTGIPMQTEANADQAVAKLQADPALLLEFQRQVDAVAIAELAEETKRLGEINETIRAEVTSGDAYVRRMRPTFGYVMALTWGAQMAAVSYTIVTAPAEAGRVLSALADTTALWGIGLSVLGVYIFRRSGEKMGATSSIADVIGKIPIPGRKPR